MAGGRRARPGLCRMPAPALAASGNTRRARLPAFFYQYVSVNCSVKLRVVLMRMESFSSGAGSKWKGSSKFLAESFTC